MPMAILANEAIYIHEMRSRFVGSHEIHFYTFKYVSCITWTLHGTARPGASITSRSRFKIAFQIFVTKNLIFFKFILAGYHLQ